MFKPISLICEVIERYAPSQSYFKQNADEIIENCDIFDGNSLYESMLALTNILIALRSAYKNDLLIDLKEIYHAELFNDFLEMEEYLLSEGYKDAAAVIIGRVIEDQIKKLSGKNSIPTVNTI